jgi:hypothetical protein
LSLLRVTSKVGQTVVVCKQWRDGLHKLDRITQPLRERPEEIVSSLRH